MAWLCILLGLVVILYSVARFTSGRGGILALAVGLPVVAYGIFMLRAVRNVQG